MSRAKLPVVAAGRDWAAALGGRLNGGPGDLSEHAVEVTRNRLRLALICFVLVFSVLAGRLVQLTVLENKPAWQAGTQKQHHMLRPTILDRNGIVLATQISTITLGADVAMIGDGPEMAARLKQILPDLNQARAARLMSGKHRYVDLKSGLTPAQKQATLAFGDPALKLTRASSRVYPTGHVMAHSVGFTSSDMRGLAGLELYLDRLIEDEGFDGVFESSLDVRVQHNVRDVLQEAMAKHKAKGAGAIVVDVHSGEVLSLVSLPDFDANDPMAQGWTPHFNNMTSGVYELGSIFKVFTAAMALDTGLVAEDETFDAREKIKIGRKVFADEHGQERLLSVDEVIIHSSNVGAIKMALRVPADVHHEFIGKLGFLDAVPFELLETVEPLVPARWTDLERATASFGYSFSVSPLAAVMAGAAMVNGGVLYEPSLRKVGLPVGERIIAAETSRSMRRMMRSVVTHGTGRQANVPGYQILGKTGTAEKHARGGYNKEALVTSFLGAFPARAPRYAMLVMFDEPQGHADTYGHNQAGWNAAPAAGEIVRRTASLLGILPRAEVPAEQAAVKQTDRSVEEVAYAPR
jgi:cell division protein FtsI (penicillin-binding protein 3)